MMRYRPTTRSLLVVGALLAGVALLALAGAPAEAAAYLLPAAVLAALLLLGGYPGERALLAIARRSASAARPGRPPRAALPRAPQLLLPRGGRLLGSALAVRPPPRAA